MFQRCTACECAVFPPRGHCPRCWARDLEWRESDGQGALASFAAVHRPGHPAFAELTPYTLALVDLDEGFRMLTRIVQTDGRGPLVGSRVALSWHTQGDTQLPFFTVKEKS
nr:MULTISPECIES: OB-fold domain-containing protein [unclassified Ornithinimicrobium]